MPRTRKRLDTAARRTRWAGATFVLSLVALIFEQVTHLCAGFWFDPLPDISSLVAYGSLTGMLLFNETVLKRGGSGAVEKRWVGFALAGTLVALLIASVATLMLLPILFPWALFLIAFFGLGLLAWSPPLNFVVLVFQLAALRRRWEQLSPQGLPWRALVAALLCGGAAVCWFIVRPAATGRQIDIALRSVGGTREQALSRLRALPGADEQILNLCYRKKPAYWVDFGRSGKLPSWSGEARDDDNSASARALYYRLTGEPFDAAPPPRSARRQDEGDRWQEDVAVEETGGASVGRAVPGLFLAESRIEGNLDPDAETSSCEWTMVFRNDSSRVQEARADILLPPGGVVHKVSLWINGQERPAAFGAPGTVREAYQSVAVVQRRDPLLVTMPVPGRVLLQCFPVPAGGRMQIRLGITAPLAWTNPASPRLRFAPPAFGQANFAPGSVRHRIRVNAGGPNEVLASNNASPFSPPTWGVDSTRTTPRVGDVLAPNVTRGQSPFEQLEDPVDLILLVDATTGMNNRLAGGWAALTEGLAALPPGSRVRWADTRAFRHEATPWQSASSAHAGFGNAAERAAWWSGRRFVGGVDPAPALAWALESANASENPAAVLWLHGASPAGVSDVAGLQRRLASGGPALIGVALAPQAPDAVMDALASHPRVWSLNAATHGGAPSVIREALRLAAPVALFGGDAPEPLYDLAQPLGGRYPDVNGVSAGFLPKALPDTAFGRLQAFSHIMAVWYYGSEQEKQGAGARAAKARLVTPLSGAVVLETQAQYKKHGLDDGTKPIVTPEPGTLALMALAAVGGALAWRRRTV